MPERLHRQRTRGWRKPDGAIIVDRTTRYWGNPFTWESLLVDGTAADPVEARRMAVGMFDAWLDGLVEIPGREEQRLLILAHLPELAGHDLACPCPLPEPDQPDHCHAASYLRRAAACAVPA